jgi:hypothetical protein
VTAGLSADLAGCTGLMMVIITPIITSFTVDFRILPNDVSMVLLLQITCINKRRQWFTL